MVGRPSSEAAVVRGDDVSTRTDDVPPPAACRSHGRRLLGPVLGRHLHHRAGRFRSGSSGRDQSCQRGVSVKPGNPLL